ncbi:hypothetical protein [Zavarzinia sp.]|uniref:hypothetical protein n=1 Tax=Zavarzinia sp. TaxID=2027920 RepID=UPI003BB57F14
MIAPTVDILSPTDHLRWLANAARIAEARAIFTRLCDTRAAEWSEQDINDYNRAKEAEVLALQDLDTLHRGAAAASLPATLTLTGPMVAIVANLVAAALCFDQAAVAMGSLPDDGGDWTDEHHRASNRACDDEMQGWELLAALRRGEPADLTALRRIVFRPRVTCYWDPECEEPGASHIEDLLNNYDHGEIAEIEHVAVVDRTFHVALPPAPDAGDDEGWSFVGRTFGEAAEALAAEQAHRAALTDEHGIPLAALGKESLDA